MIGCIGSFNPLSWKEQGKQKPPKLGVWKSNWMVLSVNEGEQLQARYRYFSLIKHPLRGKLKEQ